MLNRSDVSQLACVDCRGPLSFEGPFGGERLSAGTLVCAACGASFPVVEGIARLYREERVRGIDRWMRFVYSTFARIYDPFVEAAFAGLDTVTADEAQRFYLSRLRLEPPPEGETRTIRVLEVGVGTGADVRQLRAIAGPRLSMEIWGVDLSLPMLRLLREREGESGVRAVAADAHALPFRDGSFDAVLQIGAVNACRDPRKVLSEMARVAKRSAPIVVVDEQLDPSRAHSVAHRAFFRLLTIYDRSPHAPVEMLPDGATLVSVEQMSRFFYCLSFSVGTTRRAP